MNFLTKLFTLCSVTAVLSGCDSHFGNNTVFPTYPQQEAEGLPPSKILAINAQLSPRHNYYKKPRRAPNEKEKEAWRNRIPLFSDPGVGTLSSLYGWRNLWGKRDFHGGIDIIAEPGEKVITPVSGKIVFASNRRNNSGLMIRHDNRIYTLYHMVPHRSLKEGKWVKAGMVVGKLQNLGKNTHLHYAIHLAESRKDRSDKNAVDPLFLLDWADGNIDGTGRNMPIPTLYAAEKKQSFALPLINSARDQEPQSHVISARY